MQKNTEISIGQLIINSDKKTREQIMSALTPRNRQYIRNSQWQLINFQFYSGQCLQLIKISTTILIQSFNLWNNHQKLLLHILSPVRWPNLKTLKISNNRIESVEPIVQLLCPHLQFLDLSNNRITTLFSLRKVQAPNLQTLQLIDNPIVWVGEIPFQNLHSLDIFGHQNKFHNYSFIIKSNFFQSNNKRSINSHQPQKLNARNKININENFYLNIPQVKKVISNFKNKPIDLNLIDI